jgi:hypothetical protein
LSSVLHTIWMSERSESRLLSILKVTTVHSAVSPCVYTYRAITGENGLFEFTTLQYLTRTFPRSVAITHLFHFSSPFYTSHHRLLHWATRSIPFHSNDPHSIDR